MATMDDVTPKPDTTEAATKSRAEADSIVARAEAAYLGGDWVPHDRVMEWVDMTVDAIKAGQPRPARPKTEAELAPERYRAERGQ